MSAEVLPFRRAAESPSDADLMRACVDGDTAALAQVFDRHHAAVHRCALRLLAGNAADADDIVQQTFLTAYRSAARFDGGAALRPWLLGIAARHVRHRRRAFARLTRLLGRVRAQPVSRPPGPERRVADRERIGHLEAAIEQLPPLAHEAFVLCEIEQVRGVDAAAALGVPEGTIYRRLHDARRRLQAMLRKDEP